MRPPSSSSKRVEPKDSLQWFNEKAKQFGRKVNDQNSPEPEPFQSIFQARLEKLQEKRNLQSSRDILPSSSNPSSSNYERNNKDYIKVVQSYNKLSTNGPSLTKLTDQDSQIYERKVTKERKTDLDKAIFFRFPSLDFESKAPKKCIKLTKEEKSLRKLCIPCKDKSALKKARNGVIDCLIDYNKSSKKYGQ